MTGLHCDSTRHRLDASTQYNPDQREGQGRPRDHWPARPDTHLWYCACKNWNSSLILSSDSGIVNLKGWPAAWCGVWQSSATRGDRGTGMRAEGEGRMGETTGGGKKKTKLETVGGEDPNSSLCFTLGTGKKRAFPPHRIFQPLPGHNIHGEKRGGCRGTGAGGKRRRKRQLG